MKRIKIMHVSQCSFAGVDCFLRMLLGNMDRSRFEQILICSMEHSKEDYENLTDAFIQIEMRHTISLVADIKAITSIRHLIKTINPNIIYCHSSKAGGVGRLANIGTGIPIVYNPHGWAFNMPGPKSLIYTFIEKLLSPLTTEYITISDYERRVAIRKHIACAKKIKTIFSGIDMVAVEKQLSASTVSKSKLGIPYDAYIVGMVGRITNTKAPDTFVKMASVILEYIPNAWFMIVGDGSGRKAIEKLISDMHIFNRFTITGWVKNPLAYADLFDVAVLLSRWEGFGLVLAEYMKLEKPIVATNTCAIPDLITDKENGLLVAVDNHTQAAKAVLKIHDDENWRDYMVRNGKMRVDTFFDIKRTAKEHERLFEKLVVEKSH